jgi:hypothetical protein
MKYEVEIKLGNSITDFYSIEAKNIKEARLKAERKHRKGTVTVTKI